MARRLSLILCLVLAGCAEFPELDVAPTVTGAAAPVILPLDELLATAEAGQITVAVGTSVAARAARLRARAAAMQGPVQDPATRARLAAAIAANGV
ncbi:MAG: hypothetical protein WCC57_07400 [Paracoccaceae bacterium]